MLHELFWIKFNLDLKLRMLQWIRVKGSRFGLNFQVHAGNY